MKARGLMILLSAAIAAPGWGQSQLPDRFVLTAEQVARALCDGGMQTTSEQVYLPAKIVATEASPVLDILSVEPIGKAQPAKPPTRSRVKLACHQPGKCLPFYAFVSWSEPTTGAAAVPVNASRLSRNVMLNPQSEITMRAGTRAMLEMDDDRSHIRVAVISLENGMAGHRIRVSSPDHKQTYFGEVVSANLLKGSF